jgi:hypothetical protein
VDGTLPVRRLAAVADRVFDFEADGADEAAGEAAQDLESSDNLLEVLRSRRGHRLGVDEEADDALALMLNRGHIPAAHPRGVPADGHPSTGELPGLGNRTGNDAGQRTQFFPPLSLASVRDSGPAPLDLHGGVSTMTHEITLSGEPHAVRMLEDGDVPAAEDGAADEEYDDVHDEEYDDEAPAEPADFAGPVVEQQPAAEAAQQAEAPAKRPVKPKRSSIPSWDEIVFGTKSE